jgi:hypothetical protein
MARTVSLSTNSSHLLINDEGYIREYPITDVRYEYLPLPEPRLNLFYNNLEIIVTKTDFAPYNDISVFGSLTVAGAYTSTKAIIDAVSVSSGGGGGGTLPPGASTSGLQLVANTSLGNLENQLGLGSDPTTATTVTGLLKRLVQLGVDDRDFAQLLVKETGGLGRYAVRQSVYDENLGSFVTTFVGLDGASLVPAIVLPVEPAAATVDIEIAAFEYDVLTAGTGYSVGQTLQQLQLINTATSAIVGTIWFNKVTQAAIGLPVPGHIRPSSDQLETLVSGLTSISGYQKIRTIYVARVASAGVSVNDLIEAEDTYLGASFLGTSYVNINTGVPIGSGQSFPNWSPLGYDSFLALQQIANRADEATAVATAPFVNIADSVTGNTASVVDKTTVINQDYSQLVVGLNTANNTVKLDPLSNGVQIVDSSGFNFATVLPTSTVPTVANPSLVVSLSPNSFQFQPNITQANKAFSHITDGTLSLQLSNGLPLISAIAAPVRQVPDSNGNTQIIGSTVATAPFFKISDGTTLGKMAAGGVAAATDPALVVTLSPNSPQLTGVGASTIGTRAVLGAARYLATPPVLTDLQQHSLRMTPRAALVVEDDVIPTTLLGTTNPAADFLVPAGKRIFRILFTNNSGSIVFLQLHNNVAPLVPGSIPNSGLIFRVPANSTFLADATTFGQSGELFPNLRIGLSSQFVNYQPHAGAVLIACSISVKRET